ncbi:Ornithine decarboxylase, partial [Trichinella papuae]
MLKPAENYKKKHILQYRCATIVQWVKSQETLTRTRGQKKGCKNCHCDLSAKMMMFRKLVKTDISNGQEKHPVPAYNRYGTNPPDLENFVYSRSRKIEPKLPLYTWGKLQGCKCKNGCSAKSRCSCILQNMVKKPAIGLDWRLRSGYFQKGLKVRDFNIRECGPSCACDSTCPNKQSQNLTPNKFYVEMTAAKGWGLFADSYLMPRTFICEYAGVLRIHDSEENAPNNPYCMQVISKTEGTHGIFVDSLNFGNISRFINHSCAPNAFAAPVRVEYEDLKLARTCIFALRPIQRDTEITIDYSYTFWNTKNAPLPCMCKSPFCRYSSDPYPLLPPLAPLDQNTPELPPSPPPLPPAAVQQSLSTHEEPMEEEIGRKFVGNDELLCSVYAYQRRLCFTQIKYQLTHIEVDQMLRRNEFANTLNDFIIGYHCNQLVANAPCEDHRSEGYFQLDNSYFFGIFDGHAGTHCARTVASRLYDYMALPLLPEKLIREVSQGFHLPLVKMLNTSSNYVLSADLKDLHAKHLRAFSLKCLQKRDSLRNVRQAFKWAFKALDNDLCEEAMQMHSGSPDLSALRRVLAGSCACVAYVKGQDMYIAQVGDSGAVLGVSADEAHWTARKLNKDHTADNQKEVNRIRSEHPPGEALTVLRCERLLGELYPLRAFGDVRYKWPLKQQKAIIEPYIKLRRPPMNYLTPPYLTCEPSVYYYRLTEDDKFLILASDGLWEMIVPEAAVRFVANHAIGVETLTPYQRLPNATLKQILEDLRDRKRRESKRPVDVNSATHLIRHALTNDVSDENVYAALSATLSIPECAARAYRDDITVTVVYFHQIQMKHHVGQIQHLIMASLLDFYSLNVHSLRLYRHKCAPLNPVHWKECWLLLQKDGTLLWYNDKQFSAIKGQVNLLRSTELHFGEQAWNQPGLHPPKMFTSHQDQFCYFALVDNGHRGALGRLEQWFVAKHRLDLVAFMCAIARVFKVGTEFYIFVNSSLISSTRSTSDRFNPASCCFSASSYDDDPIFNPCKLDSGDMYKQLKSIVECKAEQRTANKPTDVSSSLNGKGNCSVGFNTTTAHRLDNQPAITCEEDVDDSEEAFFLFDLGKLIQLHQRWIEHLPQIHPFYAVKCNDNKLLLSLLASMGVNFDCASKNEIETVLSIGVSPERIIFANPCKPRSAIEYANSQNVRYMTFDNEQELQKIHSLYPKSELLMRISTFNYNAVISFEKKFGCNPITEAPELLKRAIVLGCRESSAYVNSIANARKLFDLGNQFGCPLKLLDIGGGFSAVLENGTLPFESLAMEINQALSYYFPSDMNVTVIAEPGRYYAAKPFQLCTRVIGYRKVTASKITENAADDGDTGFMYFINDGIYGSFNCILTENTIPQGQLLKKRKASKTYWSTVWGQTCDSLDIIIKKCQLPELFENELLLFQNMGAYSLTVSTEFNGFSRTKVYPYIKEDDGYSSAVTFEQSQAMELPLT